MSLKLAYDTSENFCYLDYFLQIRANQEYRAYNKKLSTSYLLEKKGMSEGS